MNTWNALTIETEQRVSHVLGFRCRACGRVSEPSQDDDAHAPLDSRCAGCGLSIPSARNPVGLAQVERHFEPLIWWDELAA